MKENELRTQLEIIISETDFNEVLKLQMVILYVFVDWSAQELFSRDIISQALNQIEDKKVPVFMIDCSSQEQKHVEKWLLNQKNEAFSYGGFGETLLLKEGEIIDFIKYPASLGFDKTKEKLENWLKMI